MRMKIIGVLLMVYVLACRKPNEKILTEWVLSKTIQIKGTNPIGLANADGKIWLSDGDHNRLVQVDDKGTILKTIDSLDRPMHIDFFDGTFFIPEYGGDAIVTITGTKRSLLQLNDSLDAPGGISAHRNEKAIADFYNNRILYFDGIKWISFGKEGIGEGEFYYPTDVQITADEIWVADAYNNRVQVFDKQGKFLKMIGQDQNINAATGIFVSETEVFVTDFENDRVLVFDRDGKLKQELRDGIQKPTDLLVIDGVLKVITYRSGKIMSFELEPVAVSDDIR